MTVGFNSGKIESYFPNLCYQRVSATGTEDYNQLKGLLNDIEDNIICNGGVVLVFENPNRSVRHAVTVVKDSVSGLYYVYDPGYLNSAFNGWELGDYMSQNYVGFIRTLQQHILNLSIFMKIFIVSIISQWSFLKMVKTLLMIIIVVLFSTCSCTQNQNQNNENEPLLGEIINWRGEFFIRDGKVLLLKENTQYYYSLAEIENAARIDNAICIHSSRFIQCSDGTFKDLMETADRNALYPTVDIINELNETCGIWKIIDSGDSLSEGNWTVDIYANDGTLYSINETPLDNSFLELAKEERIVVSSYEKDFEIARDKDFIRIGRELYEVFLNEDGTVVCDFYPVVSEWTDIVDIQCYEEIILGLTKNNSVISVGCDFYAENVVEFGFIHKGYSIPYALTVDGKLIFGDYSNITVPQHKAVLTQASEFTDVVDFVYEFEPQAFFLIQKSDGTLWATSNDIYNPEYVNQYSG